MNTTPICQNSVSLDQCYVGQIDQALSTFNSAFQCYQQNCANNCSSGSSCTFYNVVQPAYDKLSNVLNEVLSKTNQLNLPNEDATIHQIEQNYSNLIQLRESIDQKMGELFTKEGGRETIGKLYEEQDQVEIYIHYLWVVLATGLFCFAFYKLRD